MAQYLISVLDDSTGSATDDEMAAIDVFNERLRADVAHPANNGRSSTRRLQLRDPCAASRSAASR